MNTERCAFFNGSAWNTEKKYMEKYKGTSDIFLAIEHNMRKEEMEDQFNKAVTQGWRFTADAAKITSDNASREDCKHTSGGVLVAIDGDLGVVVDKQRSSCLLMEMNEESLTRG